MQSSKQNREHEQQVSIQDGGTCVFQKQSQLPIQDPVFLEGLITAAVCKNCRGNLELLQKVNYRKGLSRVWVVRCLNASCIGTSNPVPHFKENSSKI